MVGAAPGKFSQGDLVSFCIPIAAPHKRRIFMSFGVTQQKPLESVRCHAVIGAACMIAAC